MCLGVIRCAKAQHSWDHDIEANAKSDNNVMTTNIVVSQRYDINQSHSQVRRDVIAAKPPAPYDENHPTIRELRRLVGYTSLLRQYQSQTNITTVLTEKPYGMPRWIVDQLIQLADIASLLHRCCIGLFQPWSRDPYFTADIFFNRNGLTARCPRATGSFEVMT
jgi:hypothetical protein